MVLSSTTLQFMSLSTQESALHAAQEPRERLLNAALEGVAEVGWANLTISELVRRARVSKRTFYEHFSTKDECLLALFEAVSSEVLDELEAASQLVPTGGGRVDAGARYYLELLQNEPQIVRTLFLELLALGKEGWSVRRKVMRRFAEFLMREINAAGAEPPIDINVAMLIVGGINETTLEALEEGRVDRLTDLIGPISRVIRGVIAVSGELEEGAKPRR